MEGMSSGVSAVPEARNVGTGVPLRVYTLCKYEPRAEFNEDGFLSRLNQVWIENVSPFLPESCEWESLRLAPLSLIGSNILLMAMTTARPSFRSLLSDRGKVVTFRHP